jgi:hypothetical protein
MKIKKITLYTLFLSLFCLLTNFKIIDTKKTMFTSCNLTLTNSKTNRSIKICDKIAPDKIEFYLGVSKSVEKESEGNGEDGLITITYEGLVIELQNDYVKNITITNKKWKLNTFSVGTPIDQVMSKHEQIVSKYFSDMRFKIEDTKGVLFAEIDEAKKIKKLGVSLIR